MHFALMQKEKKDKLLQKNKCFKDIMLVVDVDCVLPFSVVMGERKITSTFIIFDLLCHILVAVIVATSHDDYI